MDLYFFKEANPDQDIDSMLSSASTTFKNFIMRGLYKVREKGGGERKIKRALGGREVAGEEGEAAKETGGMERRAGW